MNPQTQAPPQSIRENAAAEWVGGKALRNWSGNHVCVPAAIVYPADVDEVVALVAKFHAERRRARCVGSAISPNGLAFSDDALINLRRLNRVVVDAAAKTVTAQCGATITEVLNALAPHNLTLENLASINDQQVGGFIAVGAHGTGARIPTADDQVVAFTLVTPALGLTRVTPTGDTADLFRVARLSLGCLGVMVDATLRCVGAHALKEATQVLTRAEVRARHIQLISSNRHCRYMWIPHTDHVVVVTSNPVPAPEATNVTPQQRGARNESALAAMRALLDAATAAKVEPKITFADLRAHLLSPVAKHLDPSHVQGVNRAELQYHVEASGESVRPSAQVLAFDCGGEQLVCEVTVRVAASGGPEKANLADVDLAEAMLRRIEELNFPAPGPMEHRWTSGSSSLMSPVPGPPDAVYGWVGIVMYLTTPEPAERAALIAKFEEYCAVFRAVAAELGVDVRDHWAKLEKPKTPADAKALQASLRGKFPVDEFNAWRRRLDPHNVFASAWTEGVFGL